MDKKEADPKLQWEAEEMERIKQKMMTKTKVKLMNHPDFDKLVNKISNDYKQKKEEITIKNSVRNSLKSVVKNQQL